MPDQTGKATRVILWWRPPAQRPRTLPPEHLSGAIREGVRYARFHGSLRATLARAV
jgi:hypothetical protein